VGLGEGVLEEETCFLLWRLLLLLLFLLLFQLLLLVVSVVMVMADPRHWAAEGGGREGGDMIVPRHGRSRAAVLRASSQSTTIPKWRSPSSVCVESMCSRC